MKRTIIITLCMLLIVSAFAVNNMAMADEKIYRIAFPSYYSEDCPAQGTIRTISIDEETDINVYTPYGYDHDKQYDVVLLLHGSGGTIDDWLEREYNVFYRADGNLLACREIYDWAIYENKIKPIIVATIYNEVNGPFQAFGEKVNDVFHAIIDNFSTYATDFSDEAMYAAREHFTVGGLSMGSILAIRYLLESNGFVGNAILMSGFIDVRVHLPLLNKGGYHFNKIFVGCGKEDEKFYDNTLYTKRNLSKCADDCELRIYRYGHDWFTWTAGIYDALLYIVPSEESDHNKTQIAELIQTNIRDICLKVKGLEAL